MTRQQMIDKASEIIITSGVLIFWDALEPIIESGITGLFAPLAPFAPYISSLLCAIGFGVTSHYLSSFVPQVLTLVANTEPQFIEAGRKTHQQLLENREANESLLTEITAYARSSVAFIDETRANATTSVAGSKTDAFSIADDLAKLKGQ
ncbi:hypothetical protein CWS02_14100 [Enterobacter sp. EA-1]|nr:hypothetical protein CWS02_14100 [Enterobacter sp. EA-1]